MLRCIEWRHDARQPVISVSILAPEPLTNFTEHSVPALIETGSTTSGITRRVADELGLSGTGKRPLMSARHDDQVERFVFRVGLRASSEQLKPSIPFVFSAVIGFEIRNGFRFEALLGMDILSQCDLEMKRSGKCKLTFGPA
jgi:hypothetical protein